ncbi:MAG: hypothetical protein PF444_05850 [Bacteroidales bacterium]|jgi:lysyl endopeptidase|nr:hypothetical protein [Bacteroidales bacterium]
MKKTIFYILLLVSITAQAQIQHAGFPVGISDTPTKSVRSTISTVIEMPAFDASTIAPSEEGDLHKALKFAHPFEVSLSPDNCGQWTTNGDGSRLWQVTIRSSGASSINIIFDQFKLPKGGRVFIYNTEMSHIIGAFTEANNKASGILPTLPVQGSEIIVEYQEPKGAEFEAELLIGQVNHDYTDLFNKMKVVGDFGDAEACEKDVTCYTDELYKKTRRSTVKLIINGTELMTGTLLNNSKEDGTPYIITAAHGFENYAYSADKTLFVFNYQVPQCFTDLEGTREQSIAGGTMLSYSPKVSGEALDFALMEMSVEPPTAYQAYYAGWNRSTTSPTSSFCIHHPQGDVKKISFDDNASLKKTLNSGGISYYPNGHWNVQVWEVGATEGGSSGSGLFNPKGQFIGGLSAGSSSCSNTRNDYFYRFDLAWNAAPKADRQLAHWLDSDNTEILELNSYEDSAVSNTARLTHVHDSSDITIIKDETNGNIAGNNTLGITRFVEKFENNETKDILGVYFIAAEGKPASIVNTTIWTGHETPEQEVLNEALLIKRWEYSSNTTTVGTIGGTFPKDSLTLQESFIHFSSPITVTGNYFIGFEVNNTIESPDFGLVLSQTNSEDNAYYYDTQWHSYLDLAGYNKATTLWIDPVIDTKSASVIEFFISPSAVRIFPFPIKSGEPLIISGYIDQSLLGIYGILGKSHRVSIEQQSASQVSLNIDHLSQGIYILRTGEEQFLFQKY